MAKIHLVLQGIDGIGKSFIASILAQYKTHQGEKPLCINTHSVNTTFASYKTLDVKELNIMDGSDIDSDNFNALIELIAQSSNEVIINCGASSFMHMSHYLISNHLPALLADMGHDLVVHMVITGGPTLLNTVNSFSQIALQFPDKALLVIWLNPWWGPVEYNEKPFEQMRAYMDGKARISAIVNIPELNMATFGRDLTDMLTDRVTFDEAIASPARFIITRQRLKMIRDKLYAQLDNAVVL